MIYQKRVKCMG